MKATGLVIFRRTTLLAVTALIAGCSGQPDTAIFVTHTTLGIDFDSTPPSASIGYDRTEGYLGPRTANGEVPPIVAVLESNSTFFGNDTRQVYATGDAARIVQGDGKSSPDKGLSGEPRVMFFGTTTSVGLKAEFGASTPTSFTLGYKRREASVIPLGEDNGEYHFPSVIASIDSTGNAKSIDGGKLDLLQFFGTGKAAEILAKTRRSRPFSGSARRRHWASRRSAR